MDNFKIMARQASEGIFDDPTMSKLLIALLVLVLVGLLISLTLLYMKHQRRRREQQGTLPQYEEAARPMSSRSNHRRLTVRPESSYVYHEKQAFLASSDAPPPSSPVPEIRITFPEEVDKTGRPQSGRVVVVHVGEKSVGFSPYEDKLPSYQQGEGDRFQSLDLDRIGGLKEKEYR